MVRFLLIIAAGLLAGAGSSLQAQRETITYELFANKGKVGKWVVSRTEAGGETIYESRREVIFKMVKAIRTVTTQKNVFREGLLHESELVVTVNGDLRRRVLISAEEGGYRYQEEEKSAMHLAGDIRFTNIRLFFEPPAGEEKIFFERIGKWLPVRQIDPNTYGVRLENGEENQYDYYDGRVGRAMLEDGILHTSLRLRKIKGDEGPRLAER